MSWNQQLVKVNNKSLVLQTIINQGPLSRADISQVLGLTKGTVSSLVNELLEEFLCYESGTGKSSGGRRPVMLVFNESSGYSIGIDLGVNYILGVLTDLSGQIVNEKMISVHRTTYEETIAIIDEVIQFLWNEAPNSHYGIVGIGIGVPGIVNNNGSILLAPNLGWKNIDLREKMEEKYNVPITIENEANAGAYGEKRFGAGKDFTNLVYLSAGIGLGVGLILNDELYRGVNGFSGEMGHMIINVFGDTCSCGSKGCWELYASEQTLLKQAQQILPDTRITLESLIEQADEHPEIAELFTQIGEYIGYGINNIVNSFNPEQIIIGNRLAKAKSLLAKPIQDIIENHSLKHNQSNLQIHFSDLKIYSSALGVSAYAIEGFLKADLSQEEKQ
ncbi:ROK family transcriptional regulator [Halalkalibacter akibai]|uniref:Xylose-responsive transcription regulator n=1 Tax=Halalkalibacter akibai (strain ATCC 43226 / DSM 21942 / CIP 109018 / JCM 9157 / 1139) TaxID=1236973 RepID=W4QU00_HALA3|nr:ROK family transcriptional regulator [Halalkalibacter akibai]GAE34809.1 xylose-responsive transcription regulator [Halalkalibacter akibai JCM 9157]